MDAPRHDTPQPGDPLVDAAMTAFGDGMRAHGPVHDRVDLQAAHRAGVAAVVALMTERAASTDRTLKAVA